MGQILHKRATTTHAIRAELQRSSSSIQELAEPYHINPKTVLKGRHRQGVEDAPMGAKQVSSVLSREEEEVICAFRQKTLLPLDDCYVSLKDIIPSLTRSNLHRCLKGQCLRRLPTQDPANLKKPFKNILWAIFMSTFAKFALRKEWLISLLELYNGPIKVDH